MAEHNGEAELRDRPVGDLMKDLSEQTSTLVRKEVELAKINRRNAEIEIQRLVEMAGRKMADTTVAIAPPPPPPNVPK